MNKIKPTYVIKLKYGKPLKGLPKKSSRMAEFYVYLPILNGERPSFVTGSFEVRSRVFLPEFRRMCRKLGVKSTRKSRVVFRTDDPESYLRIFVYTVVRQTIRSEVEVDKLFDLVQKLPLFDIRYWASVFREKYERWESIKALYKPARAFREVYEID